MKTHNANKIGTAVIAAVLVLGIGACAHHRGRTAAPATVRTPKAQTTLLAAPRSLEGAWIKVRSHGGSGTQTDWWYVRNGKPYYYGNVACSGDHPATPGSLGSPQFSSAMRLPTCEDSMGRSYVMGEMSYYPRGKNASLKIANYDRHETTLCRSALGGDGFIDEMSNAPAEITFTSAHSGVYHGTIRGVFAAAPMPSDSLKNLDSITIYTK